MSLLKETEKLEEKVRQLIEGLFGKEAAREPLEIRRAILREIETKTEPVGRNRRAFPFSRLRVHLFASDPQRRAIFKAVFVEDRKLENDIIELLRRNGVHSPPDLQIRVHVEKRVARAGGSEAEDFRVDYASEAPKAQVKLEVRHVLPHVQLTILRGHTTKKNYGFTQSKINLGRLAEVLDDHHRIVRRNDLIFHEGADDTGQTVSREHAHITFDEKTGEFRLYDDGSAYGTRIFREGRTIEVQASNRRGAKLRPGDEIFLGQACIRFEIPKQAK
ncbi:MAG: FHA domain-containing protein [Acidobacteria bacterium]|nr:FHA domain-containing protein [Acidobacteriota bacterium]